MLRESVVGGDILRLITAGMYDNPLVLFREYLQNAADSIATREDRSGSVRIAIDPVDGCLTITDDGPGLSNREAPARLIPLGNSIKNPAIDRGLRGIGRLSSLAFADDVHFTTRADGGDGVTRVSWSGSALRKSTIRDLDAVDAVKQCTSIHSIEDGEWPNEFFQVTVEKVTRQAASTLLNRDTVRDYIGEVCPVPVSSAFPLADEVTRFLSEHTDNFVMDVRIDGDDLAIERPFRESLSLTDSYAAPFEQLETRIIPRLDEDAPAAVLWLAHTPYAGSIPKNLRIRGLRARSGNIQVGYDNVFSHLFQETRFNGWCVGEVHITDSRIVPNGRRDYFEPSPHLRNLENHLGAVAQEISSRCRKASSHRNRLRKTEVTIRNAEFARTLARSGYLLPEDRRKLLKKSREQVTQIKDILEELKIRVPIDVVEQDEPMRSGNAESVDPELVPELEGLQPEVVSALQTVFGDLADSLASETALELIQSILLRIRNSDTCVDPES